jgi:Ca2+-binding RTX toxin-like protein
MAFFSASANTAADMASAFGSLSVLTNQLTAFGQQGGNGFAAYLAGQQQLAVSGTGFAFNGPVPVDGVITTLLLKHDGVTLGTLSGLALDYGDFVSNLAAHGVNAAVEQLLANDDSIVGSSRDDALFGKNGADVISGLDGKDRLYGDEGGDTLYGGADADQLFGGAGRDFLFGEGGDDTLRGGTGYNEFDGGEGNDTVWFSDSTAPVRVTLNGSAETLVRIGDFLRGSVKNVENVVGGEGNDTITGDGASNLINGFNGEDFLRGGGADDRLLGGSGDDDLAGDSGNDRLEGSGGDDRLDGGVGADEMRGGTGNDTYLVDYTGDMVLEAANEGVDTVLASDTFALGANVENLTLTGNEAIDAMGNAVGNRLIGNAADNRLDGKSGLDVMKGGFGDDTYVVDNVGDSVDEGGGGGHDTVESDVDFALGDGIEDLVLTGAADAAAAGNALANAISGNLGDNTISGGLARDALSGGAGDDSFVFDVKAGKKNADTILDFSVGDTIRLDADVFGKLQGDGVLKAKFFTEGGPHDGNDYVNYKAGSGKLFYDADGNGGKHGTLIAVLKGAPDLDAGDIFLF